MARFCVLHHRIGHLNFAQIGLYYFALAIAVNCCQDKVEMSYFLQSTDVLFWEKTHGVEVVPVGKWSVFFCPLFHRLSCSYQSVYAAGSY
jgi:hypothetical protein